MVEAPGLPKVNDVHLKDDLLNSQLKQLLIALL